MSLASWKKEFYPTPARKMSDKKALEHCIRKWTGALKKNMKKHGMIKKWENSISEEGCERFYFDTSSCSLCYKYYPECVECPLLKVRGIACDHPIGHSPFSKFWDGDPMPMIRLLKKALKKLEE